MAKPVFRIRSKVHLFPGHAGWHFVTVDAKHAKVIKQLFGTPRHGWNSIPVTVTLGNSIWQTSIFFVAKTKTYLMGLKAAIRTAENIKVGQTARFTIQIRDA
ncbi:MAG: DUF1905 domain-containing protein [Candidatus Kerfeldbacteria bacterium]|nr:DUF1905 domain-containing protein [Candidatus Kerfeldbacteria bacterium]